MDEAIKEGRVPAGGAAARQLRERRFYSRMAIACAIVVFLGFAPSFYVKPLNIVHFPRPNPDLNARLMLHAVVFTLWVALFIAQTQLVAAGRRDLHRMLGAAGFGLGVLMVPIMYVVMLDMIARNSAPPFIDGLGFSAMPGFPIPLFIAMLWLGWSTRRSDLQSHKRYMLALMIMLTEPAVNRLPLLPPSLWGVTGLSLLSACLFIPLVLWDRSMIGKVHRATITAIALEFLMIAGQTFFLANPALWSAFMRTLPGVA